MMTFLTINGEQYTCINGIWQVRICKHARMYMYWRDSDTNLPYFDVTIEWFQKPRPEFGDRLIKRDYRLRPGLQFEFCGFNYHFSRGCWAICFSTCLMFLSSVCPALFNWFTHDLATSHFWHERLWLKNLNRRKMECSCSFPMVNNNLESVSDITQ